MLVDALAALVMGALSGMGVGGGGLLVIYLTMVKGVGQIEAQGLNLYFFLFASVAALFVHFRKRHVNYGTVLLLAAVGMPFSYLGGLAALVADKELVRFFFGAMLIAAGAISLLKTVRTLFRSKKEIKK